MTAINGAKLIKVRGQTTPFNPTSLLSRITSWKVAIR